MKKNSIIFLDLYNIHLFPIVQFYDSRIACLTSTFCIKRRSIKNKYSLSLHIKILEQFHFFRCKFIIPEEFGRSYSLEIFSSIYPLFEHFLGSCT